MAEIHDQRDANKRAAHRIFDVWDGDDADALDDVMAEDVLLNVHPEQGPGPHRWRDAYKDNLRMIRAGFPDLFFRVNDVVAECDTVMAYCTFGGTQDGELLGIEPTGEAVEVAWVGSYRFDDGKVVEVTSLSDLFGAFQQLGVIDPPRA